MAEKITIKVHPSGTSSDMLTVADAMRQVLDFIELLEKADPAESGAAEKVIWRLSYATTNSPFEVGAEATSRDPALSVAVKANIVKTVVRDALTDLTSGKSLPVWFDETAIKIADRLFQRNLNGIGRTDLNFGDSVAPIIIVHQDAKAGVLALEEARIASERARPDLTRTEYGAFEGEIISAGMFHNSPSVVIRHRLTEERVTCVFPSELSFRIGTKHNWFEVWAGRRVLVHGELHYNKEGALRRVDALDIEVIETRDVDLLDARRVNLLDGGSVSGFLDRSWEALDG